MLLKQSFIETFKNGKYLRRIPTSIAINQTKMNGLVAFMFLEQSALIIEKPVSFHKTITTC